MIILINLLRFSTGPAWNIFKSFLLCLQSSYSGHGTHVQRWMNDRVMPFGKYLMKVVDILAKWPQFLGAISASFTRHILCHSWHLVWLLSSGYQSCLHLANEISALGHWCVCGSKKTRLLKLSSTKLKSSKSSMEIMRRRNDVGISYCSYLDEIVQGINTDLPRNTRANI